MSPSIDGFVDALKELGGSLTCSFLSTSMPCFRDLTLFIPESVLCVAIVTVALSAHGRPTHASRRFEFGRAIVALAATILSWIDLDALSKSGTFRLQAIQDTPALSGMLVFDSFLVYGRCVFLGGRDPHDDVVSDHGHPRCGGFRRLRRLAPRRHAGHAVHGLGEPSFDGVHRRGDGQPPSYALAGFLKGKRQGSEAALKYVVYGGGASGVMLYGISLIVGKFGTGYLPDVAAGFAAVFNDHGASAASTSCSFSGSLFLLIGLAFKLSVVPFHFWCPDVFEGAAAEVAGFCRSLRKRCDFILTGRVLLTLATKSTLDTDLLVKVFGPPLAFVAALTATYGNLAAYPQNNLKRLLAYSTIAHAGYMLMGLAVLNTEGARAVLFYLLVYLFMNLGAFAVVAFIRNRTGSEDSANHARLGVSVAGCRHFARRLPFEPPGNPALGRLRREVSDFRGSV